MGFVIGKKGTSIKEIEVESGAKLSSNHDRRGFLVSGNTEQRARARELVQQKVVSAHLGVYLGLKTCEVFLCFVGTFKVYYVDFFVIRHCTGECHRFIHRG